MMNKSEVIELLSKELVDGKIKEEKCFYGDLREDTIHLILCNYLKTQTDYIFIKNSKTHEIFINKISWNLMKFSCTNDISNLKIFYDTLNNILEDSIRKYEFMESFGGVDTLNIDSIKKLYDFYDNNSNADLNILKNEFMCR